MRCKDNIIQIVLLIYFFRYCILIQTCNLQVCYLSEQGYKIDFDFKFLMNFIMQPFNQPFIESMTTVNIMKNTYMKIRDTWYLAGITNFESFLVSGGVKREFMKLENDGLRDSHTINELSSSAVDDYLCVLFKVLLDGRYYRIDVINFWFHSIHAFILNLATFKIYFRIIKKLDDAQI